MDQATAAASKETLVAQLQRLQANKARWTTTTVSERLALLRRVHALVFVEAPAWVLATNKVKRLTGAATGEDWLAGPMTTLRNLRLLIASLEQIAQAGAPAPRPLRRRGVGSDAQWIAEVFPNAWLDRVTQPGWRAEIWLEPGAAPTQGETYRRRERGPGAVCLVLGAGNVASIAPTDVLYQLFVKDEVCLLKFNPVNAAGGPMLARAFAPLIEAGVLEFAFGDAEVGQFLTQHELVDTIHITGSDRTHDAIVFGADAEVQRRQKALHAPLLHKPITSELGGVTPAIIVPGEWSDADLRFQAEQMAAMIAQNGSFNCVALKVLVTSKQWPQRERFLQLVKDAMRQTPPRFAYYPGAQQRHAQFLASYPQAEQLGPTGDGVVPWTWIPNVPAVAGELALSQEAFCGVLAEVSLDGDDAAAFLHNAVVFCNETVRGDLSCMLFIDDTTAKAQAGALDDAIAALRYGGVVVNGWSAVLFGLMEASWGAFPGHPLHEVGSGRGVVHNAMLFDHPQKSVAYLPFRIWPKPVWFANHHTLDVVGAALTHLEFRPGILPLARLLWAAVRG